MLPMISSQGLVKAEIWPDTGMVIRCQFNPKEVTLSKRVKWDKQQTAERDVPGIDYGGGDSTTLKMTLFFDTSEEGTDVSLYTSKLIGLVKKVSKQPPVCTFRWGYSTMYSFDVVVESVDLTFTMFQPNGRPIRAKAEVSMLEYAGPGEKQTSQNPTSRSLPRKVWTVVEGETLDWIAYQEYGNSAHWRHIADTNDLDNPKDLRPGQVLSLPPILR